MTPGGFGTPPFEFDGGEHQVRVEGVNLVHEHDGMAEQAPLVSLAAGAELLGPALLPEGLPDDARPLDCDPVAADILADFHAFGSDVLRSLRAELSDEDEPSATNLWPEHFDIALEAGSEEREQRATYGASPGDAQHPEPYLYVSPWSPVEGELWDATGFEGAELPYTDLIAARDPDAIALEFFISRHAELTG